MLQRINREANLLFINVFTSQIDFIAFFVQIVEYDETSHIFTNYALYNCNRIYQTFQDNYATL
ncbi:hypothetical protein CPZ30_10475 [Paenibacillus lautus]|nr:hypothetical protein CPZ30_10475 [Paenibacillus lautus]